MVPAFASPCKAVAGRGGTAAGVRSRPRRTAASALRNWDWPEALLFDCDGVLCDTERDGHRVMFNKAFVEMGIATDTELWSVEEYGELLVRARAPRGGRGVAHPCQRPST